MILLDTFDVLNVNLPALLLQRLEPSKGLGIFQKRPFHQKIKSCDRLGNDPSVSQSFSL